MACFGESSGRQLSVAYDELNSLSVCLSILQEVQPNSPASLAGLRSNSDYIIGADTVLNEVSHDLVLVRYTMLSKIGKYFSIDLR